MPPQHGRVNDTARILSPAERTRLSLMLERYERETFHQIAVLTVTTLNGEAIEAFSLFVCEGTLISSKRAKYMEQQIARRGCGIRAFGERAEGDLFPLQCVHDGQQMR